MDISEMQKSLKAINVWELMKPILAESSEMVISSNQKQLRAGEKSNEDNTKAYRSKSWRKYKESLTSYKSSPYADLYDTGDFYKGFYAEVNQKGIKVGSNDSKEDELEERDGKEIFGLTEESLEKLRPVWANKLVKSIKEKI